MQTAKIKVVTASGSPYQIGYQHGLAAAEEVRFSIDTYQQMFLNYSHLTWVEAKKRSQAYVPYIKEFDPTLLEEMAGIADGAQVTLEDILALNARSEVVMMQGESLDGCTSFASVGAASAEGKAWLAQNWDWKGSQLDSVILLKIKPEQGPEILMVTEAGILGKIGFNSAGLGVCLNALGTQGAPQGVPLHVVLRGILGCEKISDAIGTINGVKNACAANYLVAHKNGEAVDIEKAPTDFDVFYAEKDYLAHSNHFLSSKLQVVDTSRLMAPDSFIRVGRANKLLARAYGRIDGETIKKILTDHVEYPDSICRHDDPLDQPQFRMCTVFSVMMNLSEATMFLAKGKPCETSYQEYVL